MYSAVISTSQSDIHILEAVDPSSPQTKSQCDLLPLVFIHGMVCSAQIWEPQLRSMAQTRRAIALDLRGHGDSPPPPDGDYCAQSCARDVLEVLDGLELESVILAGHSFGACVALAAAAVAPHRVVQLLLIDPPVDCTKLSPEDYKTQLAPYRAALASEQWRSALEESFRMALKGGSDTTHTYVLDRLAATSKECLLGASEGFFTFGAVDALEQYLTFPHTHAHAILAPTNDSPASLHHLYPALKTTIIPNTGHWLMLDAPAAFAMSLHACLSTV